MSTAIEPLRITPANDDHVGYDIVSANLESRRFQRRMMLVMSVLAVTVLLSSLASGFMVADIPADLTTFAGRV